MCLPSPATTRLSSEGIDLSFDSETQAATTLHAMISRYFSTIWSRIFLNQYLSSVCDWAITNCAQGQTVNPSLLLDLNSKTDGGSEKWLSTNLMVIGVTLK